MKTTYPIEIAGLHRELPICRLTDDLSIAGFVIFGDPEICTASAAELLKLAPDYDYIITAESKGIPLAHEMARLAGNQKYFVVRKKEKAYMKEVFEVKVHSITTKGVQSLFLDGSDAKLIKGSRMLIVDDVISTGESLRAIEELVNAAGGIIVGKMTILAEGDAQIRDDIIYLQKLPLFDAEGEILEGTLHTERNKYSSLSKETETR